MAANPIAVTEEPLLAEYAHRKDARKALHAYITYTKTDYITSQFSEEVCKALDKFVEDMLAGKRPILVLQAPPQHGKTEIVSRKLPAYLLGRFPNWRVGAASYDSGLANDNGQDVRRNINSHEHKVLFPISTVARGKYDRDTIGQFNAPGGTGGYKGVGIGQGLTGKPVDIGIIDDPTKDQQEALSPITKEGHWNWYQTVFTTRLSKNSGQIIMATSWAEDDLPGRILEQFRGDPRLTHLHFPAINLPDEAGYRDDLKQGALIPELHPLEKLYETKTLFSDYWWSAMYQQSPKAMGGNVFKEMYLQYWLPKDLPKKFNQVIASWDCTFKDTDGTDFVVGQVWGKFGANAYLLDQLRARMSFTETAKGVKLLKKKYPHMRNILIEDKANGPAVIDFLKKSVPGIIAVEPDGSKLARAHAVTWVWEALNVFIPHESLFPRVKDWVREITVFPAGKNDDQVDALTQALRYLYPLLGRLKISGAAIAKALGVRK